MRQGVFQGKALLGMALLLKKLGSNKKIYGFDTFSGFPPVYTPWDELSYFDEQLKQGIITEKALCKNRKKQTN